MKSRKIIFIIAAIIIVDQTLKFWIKTHFYAGQEIKVLGLSWFRLHFIENEGMAWGLQWGAQTGKIILSLFRLIAVIFGGFYIRNLIRNQAHKGFIICVALIYAGALGNLIDSMFYGLIFNGSDPFIRNLAQCFPAGGGYASFLQGKVVDMIYLPIIMNGHFPSWFPIWGGKTFEFFEPVFNIADAAISVGVITIILFQRKFFKKKQRIETNTSHNI